MRNRLHILLVVCIWSPNNQMDCFSISRWVKYLNLVILIHLNLVFTCLPGAWLNKIDLDWVSTCHCFPSCANHNFFSRFVATSWANVLFSLICRQFLQLICILEHFYSFLSLSVWIFVPRKYTTYAHHLTVFILVVIRKEKTMDVPKIDNFLISFKI